MTEPFAALPHLNSMAHLSDVLGETEAAQRAAQSPPTSQSAPPEAAPADPRAKKRYTFDIKFKAPRGQIITGRFTNQILTVGQKITVGVMRARMQMGVSLDAMSADAYNLLFMVTWLQQSLVDKPAWANDFLTMESEELVADIYKQVDGHERYFRGEEPDPTPSETKA